MLGREDPAAAARRHDGSYPGHTRRECSTIPLMAGRPRGTRRGLAPLESEIMDAIWDASRPVSVREIVDELNERRPEPLAYTTVMTLMNRLVAKNVLTRQGER